ncbi:hypothetical protein BX600DRAFT_266674 [Xylariales sp. PMI_506]|nr:hypothetical protein BX600DRAFT_266674 [Xylariales sp. PMI_506]
MSTTTEPPPSASIINLAIADLAIYAVLLLPTIYITWKHGKAGMVCWPIFLSYFPLRFASDIYQIVHRNDPELPNEVVIMTNAGSIACISLALIGVVYEVNIIIPRPKRWTEKIILAVTHLANTGGIAITTYGGAPSATNSSGVVSENLNQTGNCMMLFVMFYLLYWLWPTWKHMASARLHPRYRSAVSMILATAVGIPFHLVRLAYNTFYAFHHNAELDPITGSFATRFIFIFCMQLGASLALVAAGWMGMPSPPGLAGSRFMTAVPGAPLPPQDVEQNIALQEIEGYSAEQSTTNLSTAKVSG